VTPQRNEDKLVLANFRKSFSRAQNRACEGTLAFSSLNGISNALYRATSRSPPSQGFVLINLAAQAHQSVGEMKRKIVPD
jgi:hypothetical protein